MARPTEKAAFCYYSLYMIAHITGTVLEYTDKEVVLSVGGIGYSVFTILETYTQGETLALFIHQVIKDDAHELYGFKKKEERDFFRVLIGVSGVGPKTGLAMLSLYPLPDLVRIIKTGDAKAIALVPGIGKKTSEKVVIDLKDKTEGFAEAAQKTNTDLLEALLSLGYKEYQIREVISMVDTTLPIEKQLTQALHKMQ